MSIEIYKVNNLFTIKRVSVCVWMGVYGRMDGMFWWWCEQDGVWGLVGWWMGLGQGCD